MCISNYILSAFKIFVAKMGNADRKSFVWKKVKVYEIVHIYVQFKFLYICT